MSNPNRDRVKRERTTEQSPPTYDQDELEAKIAADCDDASAVGDRNVGGDCSMVKAGKKQRIEVPGEPGDKKRKKRKADEKKTKAPKMKEPTAAAPKPATNDGAGDGQSLASSEDHKAGPEKTTETEPLTEARVMELLKQEMKDKAQEVRQLAGACDTTIVNAKVGELTTKLEDLQAKFDGMTEAGPTEARVNELIKERCNELIKPIAEKAEDARQLAGACVTMTKGIQVAYDAHREMFTQMRATITQLESKMCAHGEKAVAQDKKIQALELKLKSNQELTFNGYKLSEGGARYPGLNQVSHDVYHLKKQAARTVPAASQAAWKPYQSQFSYNPTAPQYSGP